MGSHALTCYRVDLDRQSCQTGLLEVLERYGLAIFRLSDPQDSFLELAKRLGRVVQHPDSDLDGITAITARKEGNYGFSSDELFPHTDRTIARTPPHYVLNQCVRAAESGGAVFFRRTKSQ